MSKYFMYGTELQELEQLMMLVPNFMPRRSGVIIVKKLQNKNESIRCMTVIILFAVNAVKIFVVVLQKDWKQE